MWVESKKAPSAVQALGVFHELSNRYNMGTARFPAAKDAA
jgi:hypothetical protein